MNSKQRAYLKGLAQTIQPILNKNCLDDPREIAAMLGERTHSQVVQVIGRKIVLYKESKEHKKIELP